MDRQGRSLERRAGQLAQRPNRPDVVPVAVCLEHLAHPESPCEVEQAFDIHAEMDSYLGGIHFELSGDNVTECVGGARGLAEADLRRAYESRVDPRLNYEQSLEMALSIGRRISVMNGHS